MNRVLRKCNARFRLWFGMALGLAALWPRFSLAQQQQQGICAMVKIEIVQELALERIGFEATLGLTNNDPSDPITGFRAGLTFQDPRLSSASVTNDSSSVFFVRSPELSGIGDVNGSGIIPPGQTVVVKWFIIPKPTAGGTTAFGVRYLVGCEMVGSIRGEPIPRDVLYAVPDVITVKPEPLLDITYFQPRHVRGDDPFTETVESPIPFALGVLVRNVGYGAAHNVYIHSEQPRIVENKQGLLLIARLLGTRIMDHGLDMTTLTVNIGDIAPGHARKAAWDMMTSLSGEFIEFNADYTHAPELGGRETSIITNLAAHFMVHEVLNDQAGRDSVKDFLADVDRDSEELADTLYESEGFILPVNAAANASVGGWGGGVTPFDVQADTLSSGWTHIRVNDPGQAELPIADVVRGDGKEINSNNVWTSYRYDDDNNRLNFLHIFDVANSGPNLYTVTYGAPGGDTNAPVTRLEFAGHVHERDGTYYIPPETQMFFLSDDQHPVTIVYGLDGGALQPAYPFTIPAAGAHTVAFYAEDSVGNREDTQTVAVVVNNLSPEFDSVDVSEGGFVLAGDALTVQPDGTRLSFSVASNTTPVDAWLEIYRGVLAWPTIRGVPSSPTSERTAALTVGGDYVDYYAYRVDGGVWQSERPVGELLLLSNLVDAAHTVDVRGRHADGDYGSEESAVQVAWTVRSDAPATRVTGAPATPSASGNANLVVGGVGVTDYRWTVDGGYFRAETPIAAPICVSNLTHGAHALAVRGRIAGVMQDSNDLTTVSWTVDPLYGYDQSSLVRIRDVAYPDVGFGTVAFDWDGKDANGVDVLPGWYTVRLTLTDPLGHTNFTTHLVRVDTLEPAVTAVAGVDRGADSPCGRGNWLLWQDQGDGSDEIYARPHSPGSPMPRQVTSGELNQHRPSTDGRYATWQGRQTNGTWDVYLCDLALTGAVMRLTATSGDDEMNAAVEWPWVVYQRRAAGAANDPWQLYALNLERLTETAVSPTTQDQFHPQVNEGRVVWQDWRDSGPGEIYLKDLETGKETRITANPYGQYNPCVYGHWVAWQDNRHGQTELYGFDLRKGREVRLTSTPENEVEPYLQGEWLACVEDSLGVGFANVRLIHLASLRTVSLTRTQTAKSRPCMTGSSVAWLDESTEGSRVLQASLPGLHAMFRNVNAVPVTSTMATNAPDAFTLLTQWHEVAGVTALTRYAALVPTVVKETAEWETGGPVGVNFPLVAGDFLWVRFDAMTVMDLGLSDSETIDLPAGISALASTGIPQPFSAYRMIRQLGLARVNALRTLDGSSGRWLTAEVRDGRIIGYDFPIERSAVVLVDMAVAVTGWRPE